MLNERGKTLQWKVVINEAISTFRLSFCRTRYPTNQSPLTWVNKNFQLWAYIRDLDVSVVRGRVLESNREIKGYHATRKDRPEFFEEHFYFFAYSLSGTSNSYRHLGQRVRRRRHNARRSGKIAAGSYGRSPCNAKLSILDTKNCLVLWGHMGISNQTLIARFCD